MLLLVKDIADDDTIKSKPSVTDLAVFHVDADFKEKMEVPSSFKIPHLYRITVEIRPQSGSIFVIFYMHLHFIIASCTFHTCLDSMEKILCWLELSLKKSHMYSKLFNKTNLFY